MHTTKYADFKKALSAAEPPKRWSEVLKALWFDAKGDLQKAHELVAHRKDEHGSWVHAYLHRKEGDEWNAGYWYLMADRPFFERSLQEEFRVLLEAALAR
ncbi:MAG: hypothetical protein AAGF77_06590 [Bacteroidota bacterium]